MIYTFLTTRYSPESSTGHVLEHWTSDVPAADLEQAGERHPLGALPGGGRTVVVMLDNEGNEGPFADTSGL